MRFTRSLLNSSSRSLLRLQQPQRSVSTSAFLFSRCAASDAAWTRQRSHGVLLAATPPSTRWFSSSADKGHSPPGVQKLGLGSHKWSQMDASRYYQIVQIALGQGIDTIEAGQEGGDAAICEAYRAAVANNPELASNQQVTVLTRIGYRTLVPPSVEDVESGSMDDAASHLFLPGDVHVDDIPTEADAAEVVSKKPAKVNQVVHNIGAAAVIKAVVEDSPLQELSQEFASVNIMAMVHNPEAVTIRLQDTDFDERQDRIRERLVESFVTLEKLVQDGKIASYGVASNGLSLPSHHPLHTSWMTVMEAAAAAKSAVGSDLHLKALQLPCNLLETTGIKVANEIRAYCQADPEAPSVSVYAMRPLTCYPDSGTGDGFPFVLADHLLPATMTKSLQWSNTMSGPPEAYELALKTAMAHFDAEEILIAKQEGHDLTTEQRETLDGCKLLQSLLHDVDAGLDKVRSFTAHEHELWTKIIPLIHDTFESYDEATASVLQSFFAAYSLAVKYSIARNTRQLLQEGEGGGPTVGGKVPVYKIPDNVRLQEFALQYILKTEAFDKVLPGTTQPEQVLDLVAIMNQPLPADADDTE